MKYIIFLTFCFTFLTAKTQRIADSLSYDNIKSYYQENADFFIEYNEADSIWHMFETKKGSGPFTEALKKEIIKEGNYFEYDMDKRIVIYGSYVNNKEDAIFIYFDSFGKVKRTTHFIKGKLNGQAKNYYSNGQLRLSQDYKKGLKHGEILGFYIDGTRLFTGKYKKDKMIGQRMYFDVKGNPANGEMTWRHENGSTKLTGKCVNGMPEGRFTHYDEKGVVTLQVDYTRGLPNGAYIKYKNGVVEYKECYILGKHTLRKCL